VLVRVKTGDTSTYTAYRGPELVGRWRVAPPDIYATPVGCGDLLCLDTDSSVWAVDPATGGLAWRVVGVRLRPAPPAADIIVSSFGEPLAVFDPATGDRLPADSDWRVADVAVHGTQVVLGRPRPAGGGFLAVFDVATGTIRQLGAVVPYSPATQCLLAAGALACEDGGIVRVWQPR
jgi:hypothetical protein